MSRRKQANPKPLKIEGEETGPAEGTTEEQPKYKVLTDGDHDSQQKDDADLDRDVADGFGPLVIDTAENMVVNSGIASGASHKTDSHPVSLRTSAYPNKLHRDSNQAVLDEDTDRSDIKSKNTLDSSEGSLTAHIDGAYYMGMEDACLVNSRASSPASSVVSCSSATKKIRQQTPSKSRRKSDKILPVSFSNGEATYICPVCQEVLTSSHALTKHIRTHNTGTVATSTNACTICGKLLSSQSSLDRHMLVHSGERPFKCSVCNMAFTTNGNMHRHMRIHQKDATADAVGNSPVLPDKQSPVQLQKSRGPGRKRQQPYPGNHLEELSGPSLKHDAIQEEILPPKRPKQEELNSRARVNVMTAEADIEDSHDYTMSMMKIGAFNEEGMPLVSPSSRQLEKMAAAGSDVDAGTVFEEHQEDLGADKEGEQLHCPVCSKTFLCKVGLETHLETHPNYCIRCQLCNLDFRSPRGLKMHQMQVHDRHRSSSEGQEEARPNGFRINVPVGFHELSFVDFSSCKFPLVAKAWCEKNQRQASSDFHNFTCIDCDKAFPCQSALKMHREVHTSGNGKQCDLCDCNFSDNEAFVRHRLKHIGDSAVLKHSRKKVPVAVQVTTSQPEFLAMFDLQKTPSPTKEKSFEKFHTKEEPLESKLNNNYFYKLGQIGIKPIDMEFLMKNGSPQRHLVPSRDTSDLAHIQRIFQVTHNMRGLPFNATSTPKDHISHEEHSTKLRQSGLVNPRPAHQSLPTIPRYDSPLSIDMNSDPGQIDIKEEADGMSPRPSSVTPPPVMALDQQEGTWKGSPKKGVFMCKYCPETFQNYRAYKGHVRTHLGLSPYKCNMCHYSSADKSTLVRHLRTHNGERPFQCLVCQFAFTTKANCERHVRKKHGRETKDDVEKSIGYNEFMTNVPSELEAFASPDTVCKYCGQDFKFFRALKHHLRSHSSCRSKPFMCKLCNNGFSTRANCIRHIQKQHTELAPAEVEGSIHANEMLPDRMFEFENKSDPMLDLSDCNSDSVSPPPSITPPSRFMQTPPLAHTGAAKSLISQARPGVPFERASPMGLSAPNVVIKKEPEEMTRDQPLDFSIKADKSGDNMMPTPRRAHTSALDLSSRPSKSTDQPMDLTVHTRKAELPKEAVNAPVGASGSSSRMSVLEAKLSTPVLPESQSTAKVSALNQLDYGMLRYKREYQKYYNPMVGRLQCPYCKMLFKHGLKLQVHIRSHTNERPFRCYQCSAAFTIKTNLDRHLKTRHPQMDSHHKIDGGSPFIAVDSDVAGSSSEQGQDVEELGLVMSPGHISDDEMQASPARFHSPASPNLVMDLGGKVETNNNVVMETNNNIPKDVIDIYPRKIMGTPKSPSNSYAGSDSSCELASVSKILDATNPTNFQAFFKPTNSPLHSSTRQLQVTTSVAEPKMLRPDTPLSQENDKQTEVHELSDEEEDSKPGDVSMEATGPEAMGPAPEVSTQELTLPKKKRNSYADSPHKLACPYCPRAFPWVSSLKRHILTHTGQKPFKCPQCPVMFSTKSNRERHLIRKHGLSTLDSTTRQMMDRPFKCHLCAYSSFSTAENLTKHYKEKHEDCEIPENLLTMPAANEDLPSMTSPQDLCDDKSTVSEVSDGKPSFLADFEDTDADVSSLVDDGLGHKLMDHASSMRATTPDLKSDRREINPERDNYNVDKITECWKCGEKFPCRKTLLRHLKEHSIDLPYKCYLCDASFDARQECIEHKLQQHPSDWIILKDKNKVTNINDFVIMMDKIVEEYMAANSGKAPEGASDDLKVEADYTQRKVYCSLCPKRFWSLQDLRRHMRSHTGERPFECDICQKRFTLKHSMMRHRKKHSDAGSWSASDDEGGNDMDDPETRLPSMVPAKKPTSLPAASWETDHLKKSASKKEKSKLAALTALARDNSDVSGALSSDLLHNLLGVESDEIDQMLESTPDSAAKLLGVK